MDVNRLSRKDRSVNKCLFFCCLLAAGCATAPAPDVTSHYDAVSGLRTDLLADNLLTAEGPPRELIYLNASRVFRNLRDADYYLEVTYLATPQVGFFEIAPGQSLTINVDGQEMMLSGSGSSGLRRTEANVVEERAIYPVTTLQLQRIAVGENVKVRVAGRAGLIDREFKEDNHEKFRRFVTLYAL
jgi:hypothetical protein